MKCCGVEAVLNHAGGTEFYFCRVCKQEPGTTSSKPLGNLLPPTKSPPKYHTWRFDTDSCSDCGLTRVELDASGIDFYETNCPGSKVQLTRPCSNVFKGCPCGACNTARGKPQGITSAITLQTVEEGGLIYSTGCVNTHFNQSVADLVERVSDLLDMGLISKDEAKKALGFEVRSTVTEAMLDSLVYGTGYAKIR